LKLFVSTAEIGEKSFFSATIEVSSQVLSLIVNTNGSSEVHPKLVTHSNWAIDDHSDQFGATVLDPLPRVAE
jgi:hypothetical protein